MLARLVTPRWLGWLAVALVVSLVCVWLGMWQWGRYETRSARADRIERHYSGDPIPVGDVLTGAPVSLDREWTRVSARGTYESDRQVLVRNRPWQGEYGYEVLVPLRLSTGALLVVDRGWVPNSPKGADVAPEVPPAPRGQVEVTGWVRLGEPSLGRDMPRGQVASIHLPEVAADVGSPVLGGFVVLQSEDPAVERPEPLEQPDTATGPHLAYAIQWWLVVPASFGVVLMGVRRELREEEGLLDERPRRVRIWDEEDA